MEKRFNNFVFIIVFLIVLALFNAYKCSILRNRDLGMILPNKIYANSDLYVSLFSDKSEFDVRLLNSEKKEVKDAEVSINGNVIKINIPNVKIGNYFLEVKTPSAIGKDIIRKEIFITNEKYNDDENYSEGIDKLLVELNVPGINLYPEHGVLIKDIANLPAVLHIKNNIYITATNSDGTPLETEIMVSYDDKEEKILTDKNGIGKFSLGFDYKSETYEKTFKISAIGKNGEKIQKEINKRVAGDYFNYTHDIIFSTDKLIYEPKENIEVDIFSQDIYAGTIAEPGGGRSFELFGRNIFILQNGKLIKAQSVDNEKEIISSEGISGLVDIIVANYYDRHFVTFSKKSVFIKNNENTDMTDANLLPSIVDLNYYANEGEMFVDLNYHTNERYISENIFDISAHSFKATGIVKPFTISFCCIVTIFWISIVLLEKYKFKSLVNHVINLMVLILLIEAFCIYVILELLNIWYIMGIGTIIAIILYIAILGKKNLKNNKDSLVKKNTNIYLKIIIMTIIFVITMLCLIDRYTWNFLRKS